VEGAVRYTVTPDMKVAGVQLPRALPNGAGKIFEENYAKALQARYHTFFPDRAVSYGDTWGGNIPLDDGLWNPIGLLPDVDYEVRSKHDGWEWVDGTLCVVVRMQVSMTTDHTKPAVQGGFTSLYVDAFTGLSKIRFDPALGRVIDEETTIEAHVRREMGVRESVTLTMPCVIRQSIRSRLLPESETR
jgi:hypothetical protein